MYDAPNDPEVLAAAATELLATDPTLDGNEAAAAVSKAMRDHPALTDCITPMAYAAGAAGQVLSEIRRGDPADAAHLALRAQAALALGVVVASDHARQAVTA